MKTYLRRFSEWKQLYIQVALIAAVTSFILGMVLAYQNVMSYKSEQQLRYNEIANIGQVIAPLVHNFDYESVAALGESVLSHDHVLNVRIYNDRGLPLFRTENDLSEKVDHVYTMNIPLRLASGEIIGGGFEVQVKTGQPRELYVRAIFSALTAFILISIFGTAAALIYARTYITRPINQLSDAIEVTLSSGRPAQALVRGGRGSGYIGRFQRQFNAMQLHIAAARESVEKKSATLEGQKQLMNEVLQSIQQEVRFYQDDEFFDYNAKESIFLAPDFPPLTKADFLGHCTNIEGFEAMSLREVPISDKNLDHILYDFDFRLGQEKWLNSKFIALGEQGYALIVTDISKQRDIEESLRHAERIELTGSLTSGIAHDFNNVLGIIMGNLELMKCKTQGGQKVYIEKCLHASRRAASMVHSLLAFSRRSPEKLVDVDIKEGIDNIQGIAMTALGSHFTLQSEFEQEAVLRVDAAFFESTLLNMIVNARDAMPKGGTITIRTWTPPASMLVELGLDRSRSYVSISVEDEGHGISEDLQGKIFESFFTTKEHGTGLGLAMVQNFIHKAGGRLQAENNSSGGATFTMTLPCKLPNDRLRQITLPAGGEPRIDRVGGTVLLIEDEIELLQALSQLLESYGFSVICCNSLGEASRHIDLADSLPDIIITDYNLRDGAGDYLITAPEFARVAHIPKLLISGNMERAGVLVSEEGFAELLVKPVPAMFCTRQY